MRFMKTWQDFMRMPANKALKESKGIHACKQKYIQEQNKMQWYDPIVLQENGDAGESVPAAAGGGGGGSAGFITGNTAEVATFTWEYAAASATDNSITGSNTSGLAIGITANCLVPNATDFSAGHPDIRKKVLLAFVTASDLVAQDFTNAGLSTTGFDCVVTASCDSVVIKSGLAAVAVGLSGSWSQIMADNIAAQSATAEIAGFTNTIAPSTLLSVATQSYGGNTFTITNAVAGAVVDFSVSSELPLTSGAGGGSTGSLSTTTQGDDTFANSAPGQVFTAISNTGDPILPYSNIPYQS